MLTRILAASAIVVLGLIGGASAAVAYPFDEPIAVAVNDDFVAPGTVVQFSGQGYTDGEQIEITVTFGQGLRSVGSLSMVSSAAAKFELTANAQGSFSTPVTLTQVGVNTLTATGLTSGIVRSLNVTVSASANSGGSGSGSGTGTGSGSGANGLAYTGTADDGLAYTGASIAGPLAVGAAALIAGLTMLFFGTRMAIRRKHTPSV